jgi:hypothetical protein
MRTGILALFVCLSITEVVMGAPLVYTGHDVTFSKAAGADPLNPANQDLILPGMAITRGNTAGIFNVAVEASYMSNSSPAGTEWAFKYNNPGEGNDPPPTVTATNWAALTFNNWETSLGGGGNLATSILDGNAVVHLVDQDIYLDIRFTQWGVGSGAGGSFTYERAEITPSADFDRDVDVDGRDFLTWQRGHGMASPLQSQGDADFDGTVDGADLVIWQESYGSPLMAINAVPELGSLLLSLISATGLAFLNQRSVRA